jgi:hypothetical protein
MGCDYYIVKVLAIRYVRDPNGKEKTAEIELERQRCYFLDYADDVSCDSDDSDYWPRRNAKQETYIEQCLHVTFQPRILFKNQSWKNEETMYKYEDRIYEEIKGTYQLVSVIKMEVRYLR